MDEPRQDPRFNLLFEIAREYLNYGVGGTASVLKTYAQALAQYHLHPESKFKHADFLDRGETLRWHVVAPLVQYIGKEANRWEEQAHLGEIPEAQISYGVDPAGAAALVRTLQQAARAHGYATRLAREAGVNRKTADLVIKGKSRKPDLLAKLYAAHRALELRDREQAERITGVLEDLRASCRVAGGRNFARQHGLDWNNLSAVLAGRRPIGPKLLSKMESYGFDKPTAIKTDSNAKSR